jgi:hypothetical protein
MDAAITQRKLTVKHMRQLAEALKQHLEVCVMAGVHLAGFLGSVTGVGSVRSALVWSAKVSHYWVDVKHMRQLAEALKQHLEVCGLTAFFWLGL